MRIDNSYLVGKMFKNISPDSVLSGKFGCPVLSSQETHMPSPVEPYKHVTQHPSLLKTFGFSVISTYDSYLKNCIDLMLLSKYLVRPTNKISEPPIFNNTIHYQIFSHCQFEHLCYQIHIMRTKKILLVRKEIQMILI